MKLERRSSRTASKVIFTCAIIAAFVILGTLCFANLYLSEHKADRQAKLIAKDYYENNLYPAFINSKKLENASEDELSKAFEDYEREGWNIKLREVLNYEFLENDKDYRPNFDSEAEKCDTNTSTFKFTPKSPYKKTSYDLEINLDCEEK